MNWQLGYGLFRNRLIAIAWPVTYSWHPPVRRLIVLPGVISPYRVVSMLKHSARRKHPALIISGAGTAMGSQ
jgi:hypothetical protein